MWQFSINPIFQWTTVSLSICMYILQLISFNSNSSVQWIWAQPGVEVNFIAEHIQCLATKLLRLVPSKGHLTKQIYMHHPAIYGSHQLGCIVVPIDCCLALPSSHSLLTHSFVWVIRCTVSNVYCPLSIVRCPLSIAFI